MNLADRLRKNIVMMRCTISSVREINGVLFILTLCVTGKNKAGCVLNQSTPLNFFTGRWKSLMKQPCDRLFGEDEQRPLSERVAKLLPRICGDYTLIDTKDYPVSGISEKYRGRVLSHLLMHCVTQRIDAYVEQNELPPNGDTTLLSPV